MSSGPRISTPPMDQNLVAVLRIEAGRLQIEDDRLQFHQRQIERRLFELLLRSLADERHLLRAGGAEHGRDGRRESAHLVEIPGPPDAALTFLHD